MDVVQLIVLAGFCFVRTNGLPLDYDYEDNYPTTIEQMSQNLSKIPPGRFQITSANFAYNNIQSLKPFTFYLNFYKNLQDLKLGHNKISNVDLFAFSGARQIESVDFTNNQLTLLNPNVFRRNSKMRKLDLTFNRIVFNLERPFLRSNSLEILSLSHNQITGVYDVSFSKMPNLGTLILDNNPLVHLSENCFVHIKRLQYLSLANTDVHTLSNSMFKTVPRLTDLTDTPLAKKISPPLEKIKNTQLEKLIDIENVDY